MKIIMISRDSGGGMCEPNKRTADTSNFDYHDIENTEHAPKDKNLIENELIRKIKQIDKMCYQTESTLSDSNWRRSDAYRLTVNRNEWNVKNLTQTVPEFVNSFWRTSK